MLVSFFILVSTPNPEPNKIDNAFWTRRKLNKKTLFPPPLQINEKVRWRFYYTSIRIGMDIESANNRSIRWKEFTFPLPYCGSDGACKLSISMMLLTSRLRAVLVIRLTYWRKHRKTSSLNITMNDHLSARVSHRNFFHELAFSPSCPATILAQFYWLANSQLWWQRPYEGLSHMAIWCWLYDAPIINVTQAKQTVVITSLSKLWLRLHLWLTRYAKNKSFIM